MSNTTVKVQLELDILVPVLNDLNEMKLEAKTAFADAIVEVDRAAIIDGCRIISIGGERV